MPPSDDNTRQSAPHDGDNVGSARMADLLQANDSNQPSNQPLNHSPKTKKIVLLVVVTVLIGAGLAATYYFGFKKDTQPQPPVGSLQSLADAHGKVGIKLLKELNEKEQNVFISPSSISVALSMAYAGAEGTTKTEMRDTLQLGELSDQELKAQNLLFIKQLKQSNEKVQTSIANSVWADKPDETNNNFSLKDSYRKTLESDYDSEPFVVDLQSEDAKNDINNWVNKETKEKIPTLLDQKLPSGYRYMLINAVYFKGAWKYEFNKESTSDKDFTSANAQTTQVPTMVQSGEFKYAQEDGMQIIELPYGDDERWVMNVVLPDNMDRFIDSLNYASFSNLLSKQEKKEGTIELPRFKSEYSKELKDPLIKLGINKAFSNDAEFAGMSDSPTKIDQVIHKTFLEVNEEGTEAAAVTSVGGVATTSVGEPTDTFYMQVNKPFFVVVRDAETGIPLFMGVINQVKS